MQTAAGYYAGILWLVDHPALGVVYPEALSEDFVFAAIGDLIAPVFDGPLEFDIATKPTRSFGPAATPAAHSFASFLV